MTGYRAVGRIEPRVRCGRPRADPKSLRCRTAGCLRSTRPQTVCLAFRCWSRRAAPLDDDHVLAGFDCGKESLNSWLAERARRAESSGVAHVYVWTPRREPKVCGYFAICPTEVVRKDDGVPWLMDGGYSRTPKYLIARLAIDAAVRGHGYGEQLIPHTTPLDPIIASNSMFDQQQTPKEPSNLTLATSS